MHDHIEPKQYMLLGDQQQEEFRSTIFTKQTYQLKAACEIAWWLQVEDYYHPTKLQQP